MQENESSFNHLTKNFTNPAKNEQYNLTRFGGFLFLADNESRTEA